MDLENKQPVVASNEDQERSVDEAPVEGGRRAFLKGTSLAALTAMMGVGIPFGRYLPEGYQPVGLAHAQGVDMEAMAGKDGVTILNERPVNAETPAHCWMTTSRQRAACLCATMAWCPSRPSPWMHLVGC